MSWTEAVEKNADQTIDLEKNWLKLAIYQETGRTFEEAR